MQKTASAGGWWLGDGRSLWCVVLVSTTCAAEMSAQVGLIHHAFCTDVLAAAATTRNASAVNVVRVCFLKPFEVLTPLSRHIQKSLNYYK